MLFLDANLDTLADDLALDEALLLQAENGGPEVLRVWGNASTQYSVLSTQCSVVLGAGCKLADDVDEAACRTAGVPIGRRGSGGGTVLLGPGCLVYSLILSLGRDPQLGSPRSSFRWILGRIIEALRPAGVDLHLAGISDLVLGDRKVSGNAQQRKLGHVLHHGTLLYDFDAAAVGRFLRAPVRQPSYRRQRSHDDFLGNLPLSAADIGERLRTAWGAAERLPNLPSDMVRRLVAEKYGRDPWVRRS